MTKVPDRLRQSVSGGEGGDAWLAALPELILRATDRWQLRVGAPFEDGMAAWTAPAQTPTGPPAVLKISYPHSEARHEAAALKTWSGHGAVQILDSHQDDWSLLLIRCEPGTTLRDEHLPEAEHLQIGAHLMNQMATAPAPADGPFPTLTHLAAELADIADERIDRLAPTAPIPLDQGLLRHGTELLRTLPHDAPRQGLAHGDLNPGNILRNDTEDHTPWIAIDPKAVVGDLAWDPWPLLTQIGDWNTTTAPARTLADRTRRTSDLTNLDAPRIAAWCTARAIESALWAADRGWWNGIRGTNGELARAHAWAQATKLLGGD